MSTRASEPTFDPKVRGVFLAAGVAIVGLGAAFRFWNIGKGIPYNVGQDEPQIMLRVVHMLKTGDLNPHFFDWPSLTFYLNLVVAAVTFLAGSMRGAWSHLDQVGAPDFYLPARYVTALLGTATVAMVFLAARRWGRSVAVIAAAMVAVSTFHVRESHYVLTDVPTAFFTTLTFLLALRAYEAPSNGRLAWAAIAAGLAASCKYNGAIAIVMPLIVAVANGGGLNAVVLRLLVVAGAAAAAFLAGTPYAVLDMPKFLNDFARLAFIFARDRGGEPGWSIYFKHIRGSIGWPAVILVSAGVLASAWSAIAGPFRVRSLMAVGFAVLYFTVMARSFQIYGRYLVPLVPFLGLFCAIAVVRIASRLSRAQPRIGRYFVTVLTVAALATPAVNAVRLTRDTARTSTIGLAYQWILDHVPVGATIAVEASALRPPDRYRTVFVQSLLERTYDDYKADGVEYVLAAAPAFQAAVNDPQGNRDAFVAYRVLLGRAEEVAAFDPSATVVGPNVRVYRIPK